jgi:hypothetical protein
VSWALSTDKSFLMKYYFFLFILNLAFSSLQAQYAYGYKPESSNKVSFFHLPASTDASPHEIKKEQTAQAKLYQRNYGVILGLQRGQATFFEFGSEIHWRKVRINNPRLMAATANVSYNLADNVLGYQAGFWAKRGRIALTLGANAGYYTDFNKGSLFVGPAVGFRLLGFHLTTGYNYLFSKGVSEVAGEPSLSDKVNNFHIGLRYYFPLDNKFRWSKKDKEDKDKDKEKTKKKKRKEKAKKKKKKAKEKEKKVRQREKLNGKDKKNEERKKWNPLDILKKK